MMDPNGRTAARMALDEYERAKAERPLHVRVAEALGWQLISPGVLLRDTRGNSVQDWNGVEPGREASLNWLRSIPAYDTDWAATGPLIERYKLGVHPFGKKEWSAFPEESLVGMLEPHEGPTPLIAVCNLILALAEAGKLRRRPGLPPMTGFDLFAPVLERVVKRLGLKLPDCGGNSCEFGGRGKGGQRTNGGCRCFGGGAAERLLVKKLIRACDDDHERACYWQEEADDLRRRMEQAP